MLSTWCWCVRDRASLARTIVYMTVFAFHTRISTVVLSRASEEQNKMKKKKQKRNTNAMFALNFASADHNLLLYAYSFYGSFALCELQCELRYFKASMKRPTYGEWEKKQQKKKANKKLWRAMTTTICMRNETETSKKNTFRNKNFIL